MKLSIFQELEEGFKTALQEKQLLEEENKLLKKQIQELKLQLKGEQEQKPQINEMNTFLTSIMDQIQEFKTKIIPNEFEVKSKNINENLSGIKVKKECDDSEEKEGKEPYKSLLQQLIEKDRIIQSVPSTQSTENQYGKEVYESRVSSESPNKSEQSLLDQLSNSQCNQDNSQFIGYNRYGSMNQTYESLIQNRGMQSFKYIASSDKRQDLKFELIDTKRIKEQNQIRSVECKNIIYELSSKKMVSIGVWQEQKTLLVHIRDYDMLNNGHHKHLKNGVALTVDVWNALYKNIQDINSDIQEMSTNFRGCK